ncbi:MAG: site-2 protease family protein [Pirellulales bacterium]|nr:site-2 protease family protein [Pirellulales bacterium]
MLPVALFLATCASTFLVGGWVYALSLMTILVCHEMGHFLQARRYGVPATLPFFIPMPITPIGTLGAVIGMDARVGDRKALFDIGISGPLAGLVPTILFCIIGVHQASVDVLRDSGLQFGEPLLFQFLSWLRFGPLPEGYSVYIGPMAFAGWVGLLITSLNLLPIGQLDGGHILYGLLRRKAHRVATFVLFTALAGIVAFGLYEWALMLFLVFLMGPKHPPTTNDHVPLGTGRIVLGWLTLAFIFIGFTPTPFKF